jgi:SAM-dependent methyltransferase
MTYEGDLAYQRKYFLSEVNRNMNHLLRNRFVWMLQFIEPGDQGLEVGSGFGASKTYLGNVNLMTSDVGSHEWLDLKNCFAERIPLESQSLDFIIVNQTLHHIPYPSLFFGEASRLLRSGGRLIMLEPYTSLAMKFALIIMRHEGFNDSSDPLSDSVPASDPNDPWSANNSIARILFGKEEIGSQKIPGFMMVHRRYAEFLAFLNSGGVGSKIFYFPLGPRLLRLVGSFDNLMVSLFPKILALQMQIVLKKE